MNLLFLKGFNNYFNRKIKKYSTLEDYANMSSAYYDFHDINFNPNDGIVTTIIVGSENQLESNDALLDWENDGSPDYVICYETTITTNENDQEVTTRTIKSRWFVLESVRERVGQYKLALKRDIIADHLEQILTNPCFVEKGWVSDTTNPLLYNSEGMTFNQIKSAEVPLIDSTGCPWICLYLAKNFPDAIKTIETKTFSDPGNIDNIIEFEDLPWVSQTEGANPTTSSFDNRQIYGNGKLGFCYNILYHVVRNLAPFVFYDCYHTVNIISFYNENGQYIDHLMRQPFTGNQGINGYWDDIKNTRYPVYNAGYNQESKWGTLINYISINEKDKNLNIPNTISNVATAFKNTYGGSVFKSDSELNYYNNKVVHATINNVDYYYVCHVEADVSTDVTGKILGSDYHEQTGWPDFVSTAVENTIYGLAALNTSSYTTNSNTYTTTLGNALGQSAYESNTAIPCVPIYKKYKISFSRMIFQDIQVGTGGMQVYTNFINPTYDAAYNLWCLPYGKINIKVNVGGVDKTFVSDPLASLAIARAIATEAGESGCYDVQLLPYCPSSFIREQYESNQLIDLTSTPTITYHNIVDKATTEEVFSALVLCDSCRGTFDIEIPDEYQSLFTLEDNALTKKIDLATKVYRLSSPNYSGLYEFSLAKNGGTINSFNVDFLYKPYSPYIHINPDFNFLYGTDWNDARGLILGGDYSVGYYSSAWATYQLNNKNYENIFNRQITNLDVNNKIAQEQVDFYGLYNTIGNGVSGTVGGFMSGMKSGSLTAGILGAGTGAWLGVGSSLAGYQADKDWLERQQRETRSYTIDMYNMNLENIKAMPYSLSKTDALNGNSRYYPFIEIYDCKPEETSIFTQKLKYDGMTINAIGKLNDFINYDDEFTKLKGRLIMIDNVIDDFHITDAIYEEVNKGFYLVNEVEEPEEQEEP